MSLIMLEQAHMSVSESKKDLKALKWARISSNEP